MVLIAETGSDSTRFLQFYDTIPQLAHQFHVERAASQVYRFPAFDHRCKRHGEG